MSEAIRKAKDRGAELLAKGKLKAALEQYEQVLAVDPHEIASRQKVAEILVRLDRKSDAVKHYTTVSDAYARAGQFFKAIAICKVILTIDPNSVTAQDNITRLYSSARTPTPRMAMAPAPVQPSVFKPRPPPPPAPSAPSAPPALAEVPPAAPPVLEPLPEIIEDSDLVEGEEILIDLDVGAAPPAPPQEVPASSLPSIPLFSDLSADEFKAVVGGAVEARAFADGDVIVTEGEFGEAMYAIVEGEVGVLRPGPNGEPREVARMKEGDIFGEIALVSGGRRLATVVARGTVLTLEFNKPAMDAVLAKHPGVKAALDKFFRDRLLANLLRASVVFQPLSSEAKDIVSRAFVTHTYQQGEKILEQGSMGDGLFMLLRGVCQVADVSGTRYPDLREGDLFGEISLILQKPATATVSAGSEAIVLKLPGPVFMQSVMSEPKVKEAVVNLARERVTRTRDMRAAQERDLFDSRV